MLKRLLPMSIAAGLLLAACRPDADSPQVTETAIVSTPGEPMVSVQTRCTVVSDVLDPEPPEDSPFSPVSDRDWIRGADDARFTITEYSDFQ